MRDLYLRVQTPTPRCRRPFAGWWQGLLLTVICVGALTFSSIATAVNAQTATSEKPPAKAAGEPDKPAEQTAPAGPPAVIEGFRSAHFGMSEEQLRQAIAKDFSTAAAKLKKITHPSEKTAVLSLPATELLPHSGPAQVSYILGYKSKKLIQINIVWHSDGSDESNETVVGTANSLRDYFAAQSYQPGSVVANRQLSESAIVVFRGADLQGRLVVVVLNGSPAAERKDEKAPRPRPLSLELSYVADAAHPDVFRIPKGQF